MTSATNQSSVQHRLAQVGTAGKGVLYFVIGLIAVTIALGSSSGGSNASQKGAIRKIGEQPFGQVLLVLLALSLAGYGLWRLFQAFQDPDDDSQLKSVALRISYVVRALVYGGLAFTTVRILMGSSGGGGNKEEATAAILGLPGGRWLVGFGGLIMIAVSGYQAKKAVTAEFMEDLALNGEAAKNREWIERLGRFGHAARAIIYLVVGGFLIRAAIQYDPDQAKGLDGALQEIAQTSYGTWLLLAVAVGLVAYGSYTLISAKYLADTSA